VEIWLKHVTDAPFPPVLARCRYRWPARPIPTEPHHTQTRRERSLFLLRDKVLVRLCTRGATEDALLTLNQHPIRYPSPYPLDELMPATSPTLKTHSSSAPASGSVTNNALSGVDPHPPDRPTTSPLPNPALQQPSTSTQPPPINRSPETRDQKPLDRSPAPAASPPKSPRKSPPKVNLSPSSSPLSTPPSSPEPGEEIARTSSVSLQRQTLTAKNIKLATRSRKASNNNKPSRPPALSSHAVRGGQEGGESPSRLYVCDGCFKYMISPASYSRHKVSSPLAAFRFSGFVNHKPD
jgi:hypothetical protein